MADDEDEEEEAYKKNMQQDDTTNVKQRCIKERTVPLLPTEPTTEFYTKY